MTISMEFYDYRCVEFFYLDPGRPWNVSDIYGVYQGRHHVILGPAINISSGRRVLNTNWTMTHVLLILKPSRPMPKGRIVDILVNTICRHLCEITNIKNLYFFFLSNMSAKSRVDGTKMPD